MFTNKQSLILCGIVVFGFSLAGLLKVLDNYVVVGILAILFVLILVNIFLKKRDWKHPELEEKNIDSKSNPDE